MPTASIAPITGTSGVDVLNGTTRSEVIDGYSGNDRLFGNGGNDLVFGGRGDDYVAGGSGDDQLHGSGGAGLGHYTTVSIAQDYEGSVTFQGETAGYRNTLGVYRVDPETNEIVDVEILWENASSLGSGGSLVVGESQQPLSLAAGDQIGFFVISNGYGYNNFGALGAGSYVFRDRATGETATLESLHPALVHVAEDGTETTIVHQSYHTAAHGETIGLNADGQVVQGDGSVGLLHTVGNLDAEAGTLTIGFEDLYNGGDRDFDDTVISIRHRVRQCQRPERSCRVFRRRQCRHLHHKAYSRPDRRCGGR